MAILIESLNFILDTCMLLLWVTASMNHDGTWSFSQALAARCAMKVARPALETLWGQPEKTPDSVGRLGSESVGL